MLIEDKMLYTEIAIKGRKSAIERYELENVTDLFLNYTQKRNSTKSKYYIPLKEVKSYLSNAIDKPIPFTSKIFILKKYILYFIPERVYRYLFRCYCRIFDKSVQL